MTVAEGGGRRALTRKFQDVYLPTLKANFVLWPAVQILNFRVVPIQFQIVSSIVTDVVCAVILIHIDSALCVLRRYRLDCVSVVDQLFGGRVRVERAHILAPTRFSIVSSLVCLSLFLPPRCFVLTGRCK